MSRSAVQKLTVEDAVGSAEGSSDIRILVAAAVRLYGETLAACLEQAAHVRVVGVENDDARLIRRVAEEEPSVVLVDLDIPNALDTVRRLVELAPAAHVIALALPEEEDSIIALAEAGISGYVARDASLEDLQYAIEASMRREFPCPPRIARRLLEHVRRLSNERKLGSDGPRPLTPRELEIVELIELGMSNLEIADELCVSPSTVKNHVHNILDKLGVARRGQAAALLRKSRSRPTRQLDHKT